MWTEEGKLKIIVDCGVRASMIFRIEIIVNSFSSLDAALEKYKTIKKDYPYAVVSIKVILG